MQNNFGIMNSTYIYIGLMDIYYKAEDFKEKLCLIVIGENLVCVESVGQK